MKIIYAAFDYAWNWKVSDADGKEIDSFSTRDREYVTRTYEGVVPRRVGVWESGKEITWMEFAAEEGLVVGVMGNATGAQFSSAAPAS